MEKRLILAIALSMAVLLTWSLMVPKPQPVVNKEVVATELVSTKAPEATTATMADIPAKDILPGAIIKFDRPEFEISFIESRAAIKEVSFKKFKSNVFAVGQGLELEDPELKFKTLSQGLDQITFVHEDKDKVVTKKFTFSNTSYAIGLEINVRNKSANELSLSTPLLVGDLNFGTDARNNMFQDITVSTTEKILHPGARKNKSFDNVKFISIRDRYFCFIVQPEKTEYTGFAKLLTKHETQVGLIGQKTVLQPGIQIGHFYAGYLGPQEFKTIKNINPDWTAVMYFGTFDFIAQLLLQLLEFLHGMVHNWGLAIVLLSLIIYGILFPLSLKQMRSMKEMQILQPRIEALRKEHKDNPQKLNKEIMELYKEHKVNPLGGCLPMLLQIPVFFALYQALIRSVALKGANFLWIKDLSQPDRLFVLPNSLPLIGKDINILPLLMMIGMFFQQKITMKNSGQANEQQKIMLIVFPLMFGFIFYNMPSGLVLYWFINSTLMLVQQIRTNAK
ncbi:MAG: membrane protein insertase YidC [Candidatus Omnitrophica bacterium]|nr:membrane protein insertase YidC [Candidatus Omnitrophota bacterium]